MDKIIRCSKFNISLNSKGPIIILALAFLFKIFYEPRDINSFIMYGMCILVILIFLNDFLGLKKKVNIEVDMNGLLNDYKENECRSDKKYEYKYIKLKGIVSHIEFDEKYSILRIKLISNELYTVEVVAFSLTKKCIKYIENISEGTEIDAYGYFKREENKLLLDMRYLK